MIACIFKGHDIKKNNSFISKTAQWYSVEMEVTGCEVQSWKLKNLVAGLPSQ